MPYKKVKKPPVVIHATINKIVVDVKKVTKPNHIQRAKEFLTHLRKYFNVFQKYQPLMIGVAKDLAPIFPEIPKRVINTALYLHTNSKKYLKNIAKGYDRLDLCGQVVSKTDKVSIQKAKKSLAQLFKK
jgi:sRNA-binding protein